MNEYILLPEMEYLKECIAFNGYEWIWNKRPITHFKSERSFKMWNSKFSNKKCGTLDKDGYNLITIDYVKFKLHRVVWKYYNNCDPINEIDHIDGNKLNNDILNLREATSSQNQINKNTTK